MSGKVSTAFGRLTEYEWERKGECVAMCDPTELSCDEGERIVQYMQVYPKVAESRRVRENCTYVGTWAPYVPISDNVTGMVYKNLLNWHDMCRYNRYEFVLYTASSIVHIFGY